MVGSQGSRNIMITFFCCYLIPSRFSSVPGLLRQMQLKDPACKQTTKKEERAVWRQGVIRRRPVSKDGTEKWRVSLGLKKKKFLLRKQLQGKKHLATCLFPPKQPCGFAVGPILIEVMGPKEKGSLGVGTFSMFFSEKKHYKAELSETILGSHPLSVEQLEAD